MRRGIQAALLIISAIGFYLIYKSIQTPIEFARESKARFAKVIATLKDIRKSEEAYEAIRTISPIWRNSLRMGSSISPPLVILAGLRLTHTLR